MNPSIPDHEVLRRIGRGGYGEVWLARNALGQFRAVKIVHRDRFEDSRPFEREFSGLKSFEPISRSHPSQMQILHLGRTEDSFFYVMELADDAVRGREIDPMNYAPRTLKSELRRCGRLPFLECLNVGLGLCDALDHLHRHGLIHRDVKPSNVIFVEDRPKLADVGLIASSDATLTALGTQGYAPHNETPSALTDIYALGKVLYEMSTGKSVADFPEFPSGMRALPDRGNVESINHVVAKACDPNPKRRYRSVAEMRSDLQRLQTGQTVSRPLSQARKLALAAGFLMLAGAAWLLWLQPVPGPRLQIAYRFQVPGFLDWTQVQLGDWNGDGELEFFIAKDRELFVFDRRGRSMGQVTAAPPGAEAVTLHPLRDVTGDGRDELFVSWREQTNLTLAVMNQNFHTLKKFTAQGRYREVTASSNNDYSSRLLPGPIVDLDGDGRRELLVRLNTGHEKAPRAVCVYDFESGKLRWSSQTGGQVNSVEAADLDGDGRLEVILATAAVNNGNIAPDGTTDAISVMEAFRCDGTRLWQSELGGVLCYSMSIRDDTVTHQQRDILVQVGATQYYREQEKHEEFGHIRRYDGTGREVARYDAGGALMSSQVSDLDGDGEAEVVTTDRHGFIHLLNADLSLRKKIRLAPPRWDEVQVALRDAQDLDRDGTKELIFVSRQNQNISMTNSGRADLPPNVQHGFDFAVEVLDHQLQTLARHVMAKELKGHIGTAVLVADLDHDGRKEIVLAGPDVQVLEFAAAKKRSLSP